MLEIVHNGREISFEDGSISSIAGRGSNTSNKQLEFVRATLEKNAARILDLQDAGFSAKNISSILSGSGDSLPDTLTALHTNSLALKQFIDDGPFNASSVASMLHSACQNRNRKHLIDNDGK